MRPSPSPQLGASSLADKDLVDLLRNGNRGAGDAIIRRHRRLVGKVVLEAVNDPALVDDVIQEVFFKAFQKLHLYNPRQGNFIAWLLTLARNEAINHLRRGRRFRLPSLEDTAPEGGLDPTERASQQLHRKEVWGLVVNEIRSLPEPDRTILRRRILESRQFVEISGPLDLPLDSIKTIYYRRVEQIRVKLACQV